MRSTRNLKNFPCSALFPSSFYPPDFFWWKQNSVFCRCVSPCLCNSWSIESCFQMNSIQWKGVNILNQFEFLHCIFIIAVNVCPIHQFICTNVLMVHCPVTLINTFNLIWRKIDSIISKFVKHALYS